MLTNSVLPTDLPRKDVFLTKAKPSSTKVKLYLKSCKWLHHSTLKYQIHQWSRCSGFHLWKSGTILLPWAVYFRPFWFYKMCVYISETQVTSFNYLSWSNEDGICEHMNILNVSSKNSWSYSDIILPQIPTKARYMFGVCNMSVCIYVCVCFFKETTDNLWSLKKKETDEPSSTLTLFSWVFFKQWYKKILTKKRVTSSLG